MIKAKVSKKSQIVIPKEIRERVGISEGDELIIDVEGTRVILRAKPKNYTRSLRGLHKNVWKGIDPKKYVKSERESWG